MDENPFLYFYLVLVLGTMAVLVIGHVYKMVRDDSYGGFPPGNKGLPFIGETMQFMAAINSRKGFYNFVQVRRLKYGDCFRTNIFGNTQVFFSSKEAAKIILSNEGENFTKKYMKSIAELVGNHSVLCAPPEHHKMIRTRLANLFSTSSLSNFIKQFDELILQSLPTWEKKGTVVVLREALAITFKAMCKILMSLESGEELEMLEKDVAHVYEAMLAFPLKLPWTRFYKGLQARKRIMKTLEKIITLRRKGGVEAQRDDFLQYLVTDEDKLASSSSSSSSETLKKLTDAEIRDNILTMIIAGQDTTANAITWMVKYLGENQEALNLVKTEQLKLAETTSTKSCLTLEDLNYYMPYASKVVKESLRLSSIVAWFPRMVLEDCEIQGYRIKGGWSVNVDAKSIHLDSKFFNDPDVFNPSRFNDETKPYSFLAFSLGGRTCLGMNMAKSMMLVFLHRLITTYEWEVLDSDSSTEPWAMFSRLKSGCPVIVTRNKEEEKANDE
ncbi:putative Cytochrome P450 [Melia azedarach]|uniref:Cytochrome P450 n=1 Tax=Melia azedarach TaxID=155640 RepID=A0ACC1XS25_MELAZ|nr:putative Cytochrome P450 [Melia azedarach]